MDIYKIDPSDPTLPEPAMSYAELRKRLLASCDKLSPERPEVLHSHIKKLAPEKPAEQMQFFFEDIFASKYPD